MILDLATFFSEKPQKGRLLGIDVGTKTLGLALSDLTQTIASPFEVIIRSNWRKDCSIVETVIQEHQICGVVIGKPLNMDGSCGHAFETIERFAHHLQDSIDINITFFDERLSTIAVTNTMIEADMSRQRRKKIVDKLAAAYILQNTLDYFKNREQQIIV